MSRRRPPPLRHRLHVEELEPRLLYSADAALLLDPALGGAVEMRLLAPAPAAPVAPIAPVAPALQALATLDDAAQPRELVLVDARVANPYAALDALAARRGGGASYDLVVLEADRPAPVQVTELLQLEQEQEQEKGQEQGLGAVHLIGWDDAAAAVQLPATAAQAGGAEVFAWQVSPLGELSLLTQPEDAGATPDASLQPLRRELVFVDSRVEDLAHVLEPLIDAAPGDVIFELIPIDAGADGLTQISAALAGREGIDALHLISHGASGALLLGSGTVDAAVLAARADEVAAWSAALDAEADLLLYGCEVAADATGQAFVAALADLTGADVAASTDATGAAARGGDWALEVSTGQVDTGAAIRSVALEQWDGTLAVAANGAASSTQTSNATDLTWAHTVASGSNQALFVTLAIDNLGATVSGVTYGGVAMTQVGRTGGNHAVEIWALTNPTVGTANVVASFSGSTAAAGGAQTFSGVSQSTPYAGYAGASGDSTLASVDIASASGDLVIDVQYWHNIPSGGIPGAGQTLQWWQQQAAMTGGSTTEAGAASVTMSGTFSTSAQWEIGAVSLRAAPNVAPVITSNGGGVSASVSVAETRTAVTTVTSTDADGGAAVYSIAGGVDAAKFTIDASTGALAFIAAPDYEAPTDSGADNVYNVTVQVSDGAGGSDTQAIAVTVTDVAATLVVDTASDNNDSGITAGNAAHTAEWLNAQPGADGKVSLREAILAANNTAGVDTISFSIAAGGVQTIALTTQLPEITDAVVIDGSTQSGYAGTPLIVLDGSSAPIAANGLSISAGGSTVRGLGIQNFGHYGIYLTSGGGNLIEGNHIGINAAGSTAAGNGFGIVVSGSAGNTIGGTTTAARNLISGNSQIGIRITGAAATGNTVAGNYVGLNAAGTAAVANGEIGINIEAGASNNTIGGATTASRNVVSGNVQYGVCISDAATSHNTVQNNYLGTNAAGNAAISNGGFGLVIDFGAAHTSVLDNVISGNTHASWSAFRGGIYLSGNSSTIQGNIIGLDATGTTALGNGGGASSAGIYEVGTSLGVLIGGTSAGQGNLIAGNTGAGVIVKATGNVQVLGNSIYGNSGLGIDLGNDGVTANDAAPDADSGANGLQNFPVLSSAATNGSQIHIAGTLASAANSWFRVEFFASGTADASGYGEGQRSIGYANVATDASGQATVSAVLTASVAAGEFVTATATRSDASYATFTDTSEFSATVTTTSNVAPVNTLPGAQTVNEDAVLAIGGVSVGDGNGNLASTQLSVVQGTLSVTLAGGATISAGANGTATLTLSGTQAQINAALASLTYQGAAHFNGSDTLTVTSSDVLGLTDSDALAITVTAVNDAPSLSTSTALPSITEDAGNHAGFLVSLLASPATDPDAGALQGIAVTGVDNSHGTWQYTLDGSSWADIGSVSGSSALLLPSDATARIRFVPDPDWNGSTGLFNYRAWDQTDGVAGALADATVNGGSTAYSSGQSGSSQGVTAENDIPLVAHLGGDALTYAPGSGAVLLDTGTGAQATDIDSADFATGTVHVSFQFGRDAAEDVLSVRNQGGGAGQIGFDGSNVRYEGVLIGTALGGSGSNDLVVTLNGSATSTAVSALLANLTYANTDAVNPTLGPRGISVTVSDGDGGTSLAAEVTVNLPGTRTATLLDRFANVSYSNNDGSVNWSGAWQEIGESNGAGSGYVEVDSTQRALEIGSGSTLLLFSTGVGGAGAQRTADLSSALTGTLSFDLWRSGIASATLQVQVSTNGSTWATLDSFDFNSTPTSRTSYSYNIDAYLSSTTTVRLVASGSFGGLLLSGFFYTDNVGITSTVNTSPTITSNGGGATAAVNAAENTTAATTVAAVDSDLPAQSVSYAITGGADAGRFTIDGSTGVLCFLNAPDFETPADADSNNVYDVTVSASDGRGGSDSQAIIVTVTNANDAPTLASPIADQSATEDSAFSFQLPAGTFADVDAGDSLSYSTSALPSWLSFNAATRTFSGTPANGDVGTVTITVTATDGTGATASDSFDIVVSNANDAPTLASPIADQSATEDSAFSFQLPAGTFVDVDAGDSLSYSTSALPSWLSFNAATRTFSGTPANGDVGTVTITVTATDGTGATASDSFDIVVGNTNDAPTLASPIADQSATEDSAFSFELPAGTFADVDAGDSLSYSTSALPSWLNFDAATRTFSGTPANGDVGTVTITVTATDGTGATASDSFDIVVGNTNDAPTLASPIADQVATEDSAFSFQLPAGTFADVDAGDSLSYSTSALPSWLSFNAATRTFSGTPANANVGTVTITVTATDGTGATASDSFDIVVGNTNDAPTLASPIADQSATEDSGFSFQLPAGTFVDVDAGDSLSYSTSALPSWLQFDAATRTFSGTPSNADVGTVTITVTATDGSGATASDSFDIVVSNTNDAPTLASPIADQSATEDSGFSFQLPAGTFVDVDAGDSLSYSTSALPSWLSFDAATRTFSGTPANGDVGTVTVTVTATDGTGATASDSFDIVVTNANDAPTLAGPIADQSATEDSAFSFQLPAGTFADVDAGDSLSYSTSALPGWLSFDAATRTFSGTPANGDVGTVTITVTATDGTGATASDSFDIVVGNVNDVPSGVPTIVGTPTEDQVLTANTSGIADADGLGDFRYQWLRNGEPISGAAGATYALGDADVGQSISVTVSWSDGRGTAESLTSAAIGPIANANDLPSGQVAVDDTTPTQGQTLNASHNLADADGMGNIAWQWQRNGVDIAGATGSSYVTTQDDVGAVLRVVATYVDGQGTVETVASQPTAEVENVNDAPQPKDGVVAVVEDVALALRPEDFSFDDADGDGLAAVRVEGLPEVGQLTLAGEAVEVGQVIAAADLADGRLVYLAPENAHGEALAVLWVQVADASGAWSARPQALVFDVAAVNDAPQWVRAQLTVDVGRPLVLGPAQLLASDVDSPAAGIVFQVSELRQGRFEYITAPGVAIAQFTQADVDAAQVRFVATGGGTPGFVLGLGDAGGASAGQVTVPVQLSNSGGVVVQTAEVGGVESDPGGDRDSSQVQPAPPATPVDVDSRSRRAHSAAIHREAEATSSLQTEVLRAAAAGAGADEGRRSGSQRFTPAAAGGSVADAATLPRARAEVLAREQADAMRLARLEELFAAGWELDVGPQAGAAPGETLTLAELPRNGRVVLPGPDGGEPEAAAEALQLSSDEVQAVGAMLTAGSVWWALRAGGLVTSLLGTLPAWRHVDLLAVLPDEDGTEAWQGDADEEAQRDEVAFERLIATESSEALPASPPR